MYILSNIEVRDTEQGQMNPRPKYEHWAAEKVDDGSKSNFSNVSNFSKLNIIKKVRGK